MTKPDDNYLAPADLSIVEKRAHKLLDRADAWETFPVPIEDILSSAEVKLAPSSAFDPVSLMAYLQGKAVDAGAAVKAAMSKVLGLYDAGEQTIHIDGTVVQSKQTFLTLHETGHHDMPAHRRMFRFFQDCEKTLSPDIADQFEREANNFARYALFKGNTFAEYAADCKFEIKTPMKLAKKFGASIYASCREFARTNHRACVVYVLENIEHVEGHGTCAAVRRIEPSPSFVNHFGYPNDTVIKMDHFLAPALPIGRRMTRPTTVSIVDRNGTPHECLAEAFDTTYNIIILMYPIQELGKSTIILP